MIAEEFISKWRLSINHLGRPAVGIHVGWNLIPLNSKVEFLSGNQAWKTIFKSIPPWFKTPQTFNQLKKTKNSDYRQIAKEETENGKIKYYRKNSLQEPNFCIFANNDGTFIILGDGNHRFLDCIYLIDTEQQNFDIAIEKTSLDVIYLPNFVEVIRPDLIWKEN